MKNRQVNLKDSFITEQIISNQKCYCNGCLKNKHKSCPKIEELEEFKEKAKQAVANYIRSKGYEEDE
jgi:hypothetical protein